VRLGSVILAMFFLHHYCPANTELNGARSKAADGKIVGSRERQALSTESSSARERQQLSVKAGRGL
jgi:hypothetical protein